MALKSANQAIRWLRRIGILLLGLTANTAIVYGYDLIIYPFCIASFGLWPGLPYAMSGSIALCLLSLWFYNETKQDWLGLETAKRLRDEPAKGRVRECLRQIMRRGDVLAFLLLSLRYDAFIVTVYMRRGSGNYQMSSRDWKIFWGSMLISEVWWGLLVFGTIEAFKTWLAPILRSSTSLF